MVTKKNCSTRDINEAAYLKFHGIPINLELINNLVVFTTPISDELYRLIDAYNQNDPVPILDYAAILRSLRAQMFAIKAIGAEGRDHA